MAGSAAEDVCYILQAAGLGTLGVDIFCNRMPDIAVADNIIAVFDAPGFPPARAMGSSNSTVINEHPSVSVQVRGKSGAAVNSTAYSAYRALDVYQGTINGSEVELVKAQNPFFLHNDERDRIIFVVNAVVSRRPYNA